jgi:protein-S-isoprenylcysteine O-methyltransferase Ste14
MAAVALSALAGRSWSGGYAVAAYAAGGTLLALGLLLFAAGGLRLGASLTPLPVPRSGATLKDSGPYTLVRHPIYGGGILIALGWAIVFATIAGLVLTLALAVLLDLKSRREELWLAEHYDGYEAYRQRTPRRFLPFLY